MIVSKPEGDFVRDPFPAGMHHACYSVVDFGNQETEWEGQYSYKKQVYITFEVPDLRIEYEKDGKKLEGPKVTGKKYTASLGDKATLRKDLESWRGKAFTHEELAGFDTKSLLGANCLINVVHKEYNGTVYARIDAITPLMPNLKKLEPENPLINYEIEMREVFPDNMPQWQRDIVMKSREFNGPSVSHKDNSDSEMKILEQESQEDDDLPF